MDQFYYESGYVEDNYFVYTAEAELSGSSSATISCDASVIAGGVAVFGYSDVEAFATISATISHIHGSDMFAFGEATLAAQVERIRDINLDASATFSTAIDAVRGIYVSAQADSAFDIAVANLRVRTTEAAVDAAFSLAATVSASGSSAADLSSEFTQTVSADKLVPGSADLTDSLILTASIDGTLLASSAITSTSTVTAVISNINGADLSAFSNAAVSANFDRIRSFDTQLDVQNQLDAAAERIQQASADLSSEFGIIMVTGMFQQGAADLTGAFSPVVACQVTTNTFAVLDASSSLSADANQINGLSAGIDSVASTSISADRSRNLDISISSSSSLSASAQNLQGFDADITGTCQVQAVIGSIKQFEVAESALFTPGFTCQVTTNTFAVLEATSSVSVTADVSRLVTIALTASTSLTADNMTLRRTTAAVNSSAAVTADGFLSNKRPRTKTYSTSSFSSSTVAVGSHSIGPGYTNYAASRDYLIQPGENFVIECYFNPSSIGGSGSTNAIASVGNPGTANSWLLGFTASATIPQIRFQITDNLGNTEIVNGGFYTNTTNTWYFFRVVKSGTNLDIYRAVKTGSTWGAIQKAGVTVSCPNIHANGQNPSSYADSILQLTRYNMTGYLDEFYMARGTATGGATSATLGQPLGLGKESTTVALLHFNNDYTDDMTAVASGQAVLTNTSSVSAGAVKQASATAAIQSTASQTARLDILFEASASLQVTGFTVAAVGRIQAETADLDSQFVVSASVDKIRAIGADLVITTTLVAEGTDLDLASATITASTSLSVTATSNKQASAGLATASSVAITADRTYLQLFGRTNVFPSTNNAGYLQGTGGTLELSTQADTVYGIAPVTINFWFQLPAYATMPAEWSYEVYSDITTSSQDVAIELHSDETRQWVTIVGLISYWRGGYQYNVGFNQEYTIPSGTDLGQWTNFHGSLFPEITQTYAGSASLPQATWETAYINGQQVAAQTTTTLTGAQSSATTWFPPRLYIAANTALDAGYWGDPDNVYQLNLDSIWIKRQSTATVDQFIVNGNEAFITKTGVTTSGQAANVWLPWGSLNDQASTSPNWNYTTVNHVLYRLIKLASASLQSTATQITLTDRVRPTGANLSTQVELSALAGKIRSASSALSTSVSLTALGLKSATLASQITAASQLAAPAVKITDTGLAAALTATQTTLTANSRIRSLAASLPVTAIQSVTATITRTAESNQFVQVSVNAEPLRIKGTSANLQVTGSEVTIAFKVGQGLIHTDCVASMTCSAEKTTDISLALTAQAEQLVEVTKTTDYTAGLTAQLSLTAGVDYLRRNEVFATASFSEVTNAVKTARTGSTVAATASLTALTDNSRIARIDADLTAQASLTAQNDTLRRTAVALSTTTELNLVPGVFVRTTANLEVNGFVLAAGRKISFDRYLQLTIKPETRQLVVLQESRALTIDSETRLNIIKGYPL